MLANYNKKNAVHATKCKKCCSASSFPIFIYVLNLFFQRDHANSQDMLFSSIDGCIYMLATIAINLENE